MLVFINFLKKLFHVEQFSNTNSCLNELLIQITIHIIYMIKIKNVPRGTFYCFLKNSSHKLLYAKAPLLLLSYNSIGIP